MRTSIRHHHLGGQLEILTDVEKTETNPGLEFVDIIYVYENEKRNVLKMFSYIKRF